MPSLGTGRQVRRVGMDSPQQQSPPACAEVLYLLNRGAQLEHPHMIIVPYAAHQPGPTLRDVKARLTAVRGKGMPGSFSWSYKRNYKDSFIWCDLFDDDFILPLGETGEYVLKAMEIFDVSPDEKDEYQEQRFRSSSRMSSPGRGSRASARPEHLHVENDVSMAIKKSLLLINTPGDSMDVNKQVMNNLSYSKRAPEACSIEHSEVSSSTATYPNSFEDVADNNLKCNDPELRHSPRNSNPAKKERKQCSSSSQIAHPEVIHGSSSHAHKKTEAKQQRDVTTYSKELEVQGRVPSWEKEIDKSTICTQFVAFQKTSDDDEQPSPPGLELADQTSSSNNHAGAEDPFFFGVLRRASRLGSSFRPRLCRGVDVVDSTRTKSKLPIRSKSKHEDVDEKPAAAAAPPTVSVEPEPAQSLPPVKEFKTLSEYFEAQERETPRSICKQLISDEPKSVQLEEMTPSQHLSPEYSVPPVPPVPEVVALPSRPALSNEALHASYRKTMEVLAKLPSSRGACRIHTTPHGVQGAQKISRSESKGNKQEVMKADTKWSAPSSRQAFNPSCEHSDGPLLHDTCSIHGMEESSPKKVVSKQRRSAVKKGSMASFEASTVSCRAKAVVKSSDEKKTSRSGSKESSSKLQLHSEQGDGGEDTTQLNPESFTFDSRALRSSGNKQGSRMATQVATKVEVPKWSSHEGAKRWPFEQPARPRDFESREERPSHEEQLQVSTSSPLMQRCRPLTPGLTSMDWEKSFQEAVIHSEPPVDLVLHECSQCGRTFKLESLQVHMRGCRAVNKPKPSLSSQRRVSV